MSEQSGQQTPEQRIEAARAWADQLGAQPGPPPPPQTPPPQALPPQPYPPAYPPPEQAVDPVTAQMNERLQNVMTAVQRAADAIRADAEEQARRQLFEAQQKADMMTSERVRMISDLTDDLIEHASIVRDHSELMVTALERAVAGVGSRLQEISDSTPGQPEAPAADSGTPEAAGEDVSSTILLRATQLAIAGHSRESIADRIRTEFSVDPEPVLQQVLG